MRILFAAAEVDPFAKVGGLADVAAALPQRLHAIGHDVRVVMPCHRSAQDAFSTASGHRRLSVRMAGQDHAVEIATVATTGGALVELVQNPHYFDRANVYGEPDDLVRYQFFCRVILQMIREEAPPDILHLNDWHTAACAFALRNLAWSDPELRKVASVFTIHNLRYRGPDEFNDLLSQAIYYSDMVTTVSPGYARETLTADYGEGLDSLLGLRPHNYRGILNGLDYDHYNPQTDHHLDTRYDVNSLERRAVNKDALRDEFGLPASEGPLAGMVTRLTEQKGIDLVLQAVPAMIAADSQLVVLGDGDDSLKGALRRLEVEHPRHVRLAPRFDDGLAQRIYAGSDVFLMPSRYEPCGLGQLIAMRYGSVPIGRRTGGLGDTIFDAGEGPEFATGFLFDEFSTAAFVRALERATVAFRDKPGWRSLQVNGMTRDFSWNASADRYVETYLDALRGRGVSTSG